MKLGNKKVVASIIRHPGRADDYRVDLHLVDEDKDRQEFKEETQKRLLGIFECVSVTDRIGLGKGFDIVVTNVV